MTGQCAACGAELGAEDRFCRRCGAAVPAAVATGESWVDLVDEPAQPSAAAPAFASHPAEPPAFAPAPGPLPDAQAVDPAATEPAARDDGNRRKLTWLLVLLVGIVGAVAIVGWAMQWSQGRGGSTVVAEEGDDPAPAHADPWQAAYRDVYVGEGEVTLVTSGEARQRDYPTTEGTVVQRTLPAGTSVAGRWVRGRDATTKWLKLAGGGYVWEGNLAQPGGAGSPIELTINNRRADLGPDLEAYLDQARAQARARYARIEALPEKERLAQLGNIEEASVYVRVPNRRWRGLTVTSVAQHYESHGLTFREDVGAVRRALAAAGVTVDADGIIPQSEEEAVTCAITSTDDWPAARAYGATSLTCGV